MRIGSTWRKTKVLTGAANFTKPSYARPGLVYFVQRPSDLAVKVGFTTNIGLRVPCLASIERQPLRMLGVVRGTKRLEREIHEWFAKDVVLGGSIHSGCEWFAPSEALFWFVSQFAAMPLDPHSAPRAG